MDLDLMIDAVTGGDPAAHLEEVDDIKPPTYWIPCLIILAVASVVGTFGNVTILFLIFTKKRLRNVETIFIVNLAISDLYVTTLADPMSLVAKVSGEKFFKEIPGLCKAIAFLCTISCVTSLMTIAMMSVNRYFYICANDLYEKIFTKRNCIYICVSLYSVGCFLVFLNALGIGDHSFDPKSLECIWDRMATYSYTVAFSITLVWIPSLTIGLFYLRIFLFVRKHRIRMEAQKKSRDKGASTGKNAQLAKTLFVIYAVFVTCWAPYALLIVLDSENSFSHEVHVYVTMFAHLHPSINWIIYYTTNKNFTTAYNQLFRRMMCCCKFSNAVHDETMVSRNVNSTVVSVVKESGQKVND